MSNNIRTDLASLKTEGRNQNTLHIDQRTTIDMVTVMNNEHRVVEDAIATQLPEIAKAIDTQKPLTAVTKAVLAEMVSAKDDLEKQQMQMLYDSLNQTRSEYLHKICLEVESQPLAAFADQQMFVKLWPTHKKDLAEAALKLKAIPGLDKLGALYAKMMVWADPKFKPKNEAAAKKIVAELNNVKKQLSKFKDSKVPQVAAACQVAESKLDELISDIPGRVQGQ